jgi:hypothetical protein
MNIADENIIASVDSANVINKPNKLEFLPFSSLVLCFGLWPELTLTEGYVRQHLWLVT